MAGAILSDAPEVITSEPGEDAGDAFLRAFTADPETVSDSDEEEDKKAKPKADDKDETSEETPEETDDSDADEETDEDDDSEDKPEAKEKTNARVVLEADAEAFVKHKVDGKDVEIPVKDLTRLYGQEAALTRKSQETAELRKVVDDTGAKYNAGLEALLSRALESFKPYADLNFLALAKDPDITAEDIAALQKQAGDKYADVQFLTTKLEETVRDAAQARHTTLVKAAGEAWKVLADPTTGIPGWSTDTYNEVRTYAKAAGIPAQSVDELVDPIAVKILHKAMLYDKGKSADVKTIKVDKEPKRIIKSSSNAVVTKSKGSAKEASFAKLVKSGTAEDASDYFLAQMQS